MTTSPALIAPKTCRRCKGTGYVASRVMFAGDHGTCFDCAGVGQVEGDKATLAALKAAREAQQEASRRFQAALDATAAPEIRDADDTKFARIGLLHLSTNDPERAAKAVESVLAGHPKVMTALHDYFRENNRLRRP